MTATEQWIFLCAAHKTPKECPAIGESKTIYDFKGKTKIRTGHRRLHSAHFGRGGLPSEQQQVLPQQSLHQGEQQSSFEM